ncbi:MAG: GTP cyclohydrolase I FolE2 [Halobacteriovoraceae bacterium]|nr:GTP cyclohydrolase I FolE2 [Halobacteriovoraceae bacterium]
MNLEALRNNHQKILDCDIKDDTGLNDFQKIPDKHACSINKVGIERFRLPISIKHDDGTLMSHDSHASMFVYLQEGKTGVNMSRFCAIVQEEVNRAPLCSHLIEGILERFRKDLRDFDDEELIPESYLTLKFQYAVKQPSLKSENWGWQYYKVSLNGSDTPQGKLLTTTINYEYSSTCPCSLSMAKQYEKEYAEGLTTEGNGIATAHSQRSVATVDVTCKMGNSLTIDEIISLLRIALPTETQSLVKRVDEQAFAILNGENPMFVEHASRRLSKVLNSDKRIIDWKAKVDHLESLHSHNAVAYISKN